MKKGGINCGGNVFFFLIADNVDNGGCEGNQFDDYESNQTQLEMSHITRLHLRLQDAAVVEDEIGGDEFETRLFGLQRELHDPFITWKRT